MYAREYLKRALDTTNGFISSGSEATKVDPAMYEQKLHDYEEERRVLSTYATTFDFTGPGSTFTVTVDAAPTAATSVAETADASISSVSFRQVTFTPTEQAKAFQVTRAQMARGFFSAMDNFTKKLGTALAYRKDDLARTALLSLANTAWVNGKTALTDIASTDTLNMATILKGIRLIEEDLYFNHKVLVVSPQQKEQLAGISTLYQANTFGSRNVIEKGVVGQLLGLNVVMASNITTQSSGSTPYARAFILSESISGEQALGYAVKRKPMIETEYHALGRYWDIVAHEEYNFQLLHPNAGCQLITYQA